MVGRLSGSVAPLKRRHALVGVVVATLLVGSIPPAPLQAQGVDDYHVEAFGDPMDFGNTEDHVIADEAMLFGTRNASMSDGQLHFDASGPAYFSPLWGGYATGIPHGREGSRRPLDADRYKRIVVRMNAPGGVPAMVRWFTCREANNSCSGGTAFTTTDGWQTYDLTLGPNTGDPAVSKPWSGQVLAVRLLVIPSGAAHFDVDWVRFVSAGTSPVEEIAGGAPPPPFPTDRLDYASYAGNAWDWDTIDDASPINLASARVSGGRLEGCNRPTTAKDGDPGIALTLPGRLPIDANRFKTLTVEYSYQGPFSVKSVPGGGMVARIFWTDSRGRHPTKGIHLYPNEGWFSIRLDDPSVAFEGLEPGKGQATGAPWAGQVTQFRFDPNQDAGSRCWTIGRVWLTADEPSAGVTPLVPAVIAAPRVASAQPRVAAAPKARSKKQAKTTKRRAKRTTATTKR